MRTRRKSGAANACSSEVMTLHRPCRKTECNPKAHHMEAIDLSRTKNGPPETHSRRDKEQWHFGILLREFYPPEMSNERCQAYNDGTLERHRRPAQGHQGQQCSGALVQSDIRLYGLNDSSAESGSCGSDRAYSASIEARFERLDIPLCMEPQDVRKSIPQRIVDLCEQWGANHLYRNLEYEADELQREKLVRLCAKNGINFKTAHDACVLPPWTGDQSASEVPAAPENKQLSEKEKKQLSQLYPADEHEALRRLEAFLEEKVRDYKEARNMMCRQTTSILNPYFASGLLSTRTAFEHARRPSKGCLQHGDPGLVQWIGEVAWREFCRHVLVHWPSIWSTTRPCPPRGPEGNRLPYSGRRHATGEHDKWMQNRTRMIVASFLSKDLLINWRRGERYVMETLIDGDSASHHGGWGFGSSTG
ncbi:hypothetical protein CNMCM8694_002426 [Aspergillus lentulus]|nr:hypothetical protein CNMCM8060_002697 [Aspergillus lentulus]KAF4191058.1 hypothetical protein CNMCM8694_002426 [Aspergillus lentulus]